MTTPHAHEPHHGHAHALRARASAPTLSLLRLSAGQRLASASVALVALWLAILSVIGWI